MSDKESLRWSINKLRKAYSQNFDNDLAIALHKVLNWAINEGIFMSTHSPNPCFGLLSKTRHRLASFHSDGIITIFLSENSFLEGVTERSSLIAEIEKINPLKVHNNLNKNIRRKDLSRKVYELSGTELDDLLMILRKYCG